MAAGRLNLKIEQGARFQMNWTWKDSNGAAKDLTGYSAEMQIRETADSVSSLYDSDTGSDITITPSTGLIALDIPTATTELFTFDKAKWELEIDDGSGEKSKLLRGNVRLVKEIVK